MAFVITQSCCGDASCVSVCPVQCIRPRPDDPDFTTAEQLYIDPNSCIDCGACATACPVEAIYPEAELTQSGDAFRDMNADYFATRALSEVTPLPITRHALSRERPECRVAIVGAGASALYAAAELSEIRGGSVTILERTPTPYGLIRSGVAPDHNRTKLMGEHFAQVLRRPNVTCLFNVEVGRDVSVDELLRHHHAVLWAAGASDDRTMNIPGEDRAGSVAAGDFISWYNGHPDFADRQFDLSGKRAVIIGNGNVALDVARVLALPVTTYEKSSMSDIALGSLRTSAIEEVVIVGRRGQVFAACSTSELLAMSRLPGVDLVADPAEATVAEHELEAVSPRGSTVGFAQRRAIIDAAAQREWSAARRIVMRFRLSPTELVGDDAVSGVVFKRPDGTTEILETSLVVRAIGFRGRAAPGLPFDDSAGVIPNVAGRVTDPTTKQPVRGVYCTGWIKRGPTGGIGSNRADSAETISSLLSDLAEQRLAEPSEDVPRLIDLISDRRPELVDASGWWRIDEAEKRAGSASGRQRVQLPTFEGLLRAARGG